MAVEQQETALQYQESLIVGGMPELTMHLPTLSETEDFRVFISDNVEHLANMDPTVIEKVTFEGAEKAIKSSLADLQAGTRIPYRLKANGKIVGNVALHHFDHQEKSAELGYWLGYEHQGKGYATHACMQLVQIAFSELGLERLDLKIAKDNASSERVAERLGAKLNGVDSSGQTTKNLWEITKP